MVLLLLFISLLANPASHENYSSDSGANKNIEELIAHFEKKGTDIKPLLEDERFELIDGIKEKFTRSAEKKIEGLEDYKKAVGFDRKLTLLDTFIETYSDELAEAEKEYGIPKEVIVGIIGIESEFGTYSGKYNPFSAYVSMYAVGYRSKFALAQLEELLKWTEKNEVDVLDLKSSYAGAMSYAQFVPWSLNRWFVGTDLYHMPNNISSVGNYLAHYKNVTGTIEKSILRYNPSSLYQQAVLALAEEAKKVTG